MTYNETVVFICQKNHTSDDFMGYSNGKWVKLAVSKSSDIFGSSRTYTFRLPSGSEYFYCRISGAELESAVETELPAPPSGYKKYFIDSSIGSVNYVCYKKNSDGKLSFIGYDENDGWVALTRNATILDNGNEYEGFIIVESGYLYFGHSGKNIYPEIEPGKKAGTTYSAEMPTRPNGYSVFLTVYAKGVWTNIDELVAYIVNDDSIYASSRFMGYDKNSSSWRPLTRTTETLSNGEQSEKFTWTDTGAVYYSRTGANLITPDDSASSEPKNGWIPIPTEPSEPAETEETAVPTEPSAEETTVPETQAPSEPSGSNPETETETPTEQTTGKSTEPPETTAGETAESKPEETTKAVKESQAEETETKAESETTVTKTEPAVKPTTKTPKPVHSEPEDEKEPVPSEPKASYEE